MDDSGVSALSGIGGQNQAVAAKMVGDTLAARGEYQAAKARADAYLEAEKAKAGASRGNVFGSLLGAGLSSILSPIGGAAAKKLFPG